MFINSNSFNRNQFAAGNIEIRPFPKNSSVTTADAALVIKVKKFWLNEFKIVSEFRNKVRLLANPNIDWEWLSQLITIILYNQIIIYKCLITISKIGAEYVDYVDSIEKTQKFKNFNTTTTNDVQKIVNYATQFPSSIEKLFLNSTFSYYKLLNEHEEHIKILDENQVKRLFDLVNAIKIRAEKPTNIMGKLPSEIQNNLKTFFEATHQIESSLNSIDSTLRSNSERTEFAEDVTVQVAEQIEKMITNVDICKKEMLKKRLKVKLKIQFQKLKKSMHEANNLQKDLPLKIEKILRKSTKYPPNLGICRSVFKKQCFEQKNYPCK